MVDFTISFVQNDIRALAHYNSLEINVTVFDSRNVTHKKHCNKAIVSKPLYKIWKQMVKKISLSISFKQIRLIKSVHALIGLFICYGWKILYLMQNQRMKRILSDLQYSVFNDRFVHY